MTRAETSSWLMDMDGVLVHEEQAIPGADRFVATLRDRGAPFLVLTNNSIYTQRDLSARLRAILFPPRQPPRPPPSAPGPPACGPAAWRSPRSRSGPRPSPPHGSSPT